MWGENVILDGSDVKGVINWKDCRVGDPYEDIVLLLLDWLRIGAIRGADASLFCQNILRGLDVYRADSEFRVQLVFRIQAEVTRRMEELKNRKNEHGYADDYIYLRNVEIFLELYRDQIGSMQEKI
jgi:aminoglycoside phosphotransferase (APT) family kinase protein